jgi:hypothetical protein
MVDGGKNSKIVSIWRNNGTYTHFIILNKIQKSKPVIAVEVNSTIVV